MENSGDTLRRIFRTVKGRKSADPGKSYVASLFAGGRARIVAKIEEESAEVAEAAMAEDRRQIVHESADLLFHLMVLWASAGIAPDDVIEELKRREGTSGHNEKAARTPKEEP